MVEVGQRMKFIPCWDYSSKDTAQEKKNKIITGVVVKVNAKHLIFFCEYDHYGPKQIESFKFQDIGNTVWRV